MKAIAMQYLQDWKIKRKIQTKQSVFWSIIDQMHEDDNEFWRKRIIEWLKNCERLWYSVKRPKELLQNTRNEVNTVAKPQEMHIDNIEYMLKAHYIDEIHQIDIAKKLWVSQPTVSTSIRKWIKAQIRKNFPEAQKPLF